MKTLDDVIKELQRDVIGHTFAEEKRLKIGVEIICKKVAQAMAKKIVPKKKTKTKPPYHCCEFNDCRDELINKIEEFMGEEK